MASNKTEHKTISPDAIRPNPNNPRIIKDYAYKRLVESLRQFPQMLEARRIVVDETMTILGGNARWHALREIGVDKIPVAIVHGWTDEQKREFVVKDNLHAGQFDIEMLANDYELNDLKEWGFNVDTDPSNFDSTGFEPKTEPETRINDVTQAEIEKRAEVLAKQMIQNQRIQELICPHCNEPFEITI